MFTYIISLLAGEINKAHIGANAVMGYSESIDKSCGCPVIALSVKGAAVENRSGEYFISGYKKADITVGFSGYFDSAESAYEIMLKIAEIFLNFNGGGITIDLINLGSPEYKKQCGKFVCGGNMKISVIYKGESSGESDGVISDIIMKGEVGVNDLR